MKQTKSFGPFQLYVNPLQLREGRRVVDLSTRQLEVLSLLVIGKGKTISKELFFAKVWHDSHVDDGNLTQTIFLLRKALGKLSNGKDYIETVAGKGYRLAASTIAVPSAGNDATKPTNASAGRIAGRLDDQQYRLMIDVIEDYSVVMLDCAGRVVAWNRGAEKCSGFTDVEVTGVHYSLLFTPEDIEARIPTHHLTFAAKQGHIAGEGWRMRKNGDRFWASFVISACRSHDGKLVGFTKLERDLSDSKRNHDALLRVEALVRRERDLLSAAAEGGMDAFMICEAIRDRQGNVEDFIFTYLNKNVARFFSPRRDQLLGGRVGDLLPIQQATQVSDALKKVLSTGIAYVAELPFTPNQSGYQWIRMQGVRLENGIAITLTDITEQKLSQPALLYPSSHDALTGLASKSLLTDRIDQLMKRVKRNGGNFAVALLDIDRFGRLNENCGASVGDRVLIETAARLQTHFRASDSVSRIGADEFAILFENEAIPLVAKKLAHVVSIPMRIDSLEFKLTCSIGIASYPHAASNVEGLLSKAGDAMSRAKDNGGNSIEIIGSDVPTISQQPHVVGDSTQLLSKDGLSQFP